MGKGHTPPVARRQKVVRLVVPLAAIVAVLAIAFYPGRKAEPSVTVTFAVDDSTGMRIEVVRVNAGDPNAVVVDLRDSLTLSMRRPDGEGQEEYSLKSSRTAFVQSNQNGIAWKLVGPDSIYSEFTQPRFVEDLFNVPDDAPDWVRGRVQAQISWSAAQPKTVEEGGASIPVHLLGAESGWVLAKLPFVSRPE